MIRAALLSLLLVAPLWAQSKEIDLKPADEWVDSGIDLQAGDTVKITATGELQFSNAKQSNGPEGLPRGWTDLVRNLQFNDAGRGALIGRIGSSEAARAFLIGAELSSQAPIAAVPDSKVPGCGACPVCAALWRTPAPSWRSRQRRKSCHSRYRPTFCN